MLQFLLELGCSHHLQFRLLHSYHHFSSRHFLFFRQLQRQQWNGDFSSSDLFGLQQR